MSASLVGSEMCIRDRFSRSLPGTEGEGAEGGASKFKELVIFMGCSVEAVSYTHLTLPTICSV
eukprot:15041799-Alexandrium_andersonii.AAC.1